MPTATKAAPAKSKSITAQDILKQLKTLGNDGYKKILMNHGIKEPIYGVKIEEMKSKFVKPIKRDYQLALDLYETGVYDAMYLAGLIADDAKMTKKDLQRWVEKAGGALCGCTVPWVAAESNHGRELALEWIESKKESVAAAGWATLGGLLALKDDSELDLAEIRKLLQRVQKTIHQAPNGVRYAMNGFVIGVGSYIKSLTDEAIKVAKAIGKVSVDMGDTACKVPDAVEYINKIKQRGRIGKKRKTVKC
jgi:3-methyladenine DNA glycosylase AlkD